MNDRFLRACRRRAGRRDAGLVHAPGRPVASPSTARSASARRSCRASPATPALCAEVTLQPVERARRRRGDRCSPTSRRRCGPWASTSSIAEASGRSSTEPIRTAADVERSGRSTRARRSGHCSRRSGSSGASSSPVPRHRLRRRAVHARLLPHRGPTVARLRDAPRRCMHAEPAAWTTLMDRLVDDRPSPTSGRRSRPAPRSSRCSTRGSAPWRRATTASSVAPHMRRLFDGLAGLVSRSIHFGTGDGRAARRSWRRPAATSSGSTGGSSLGRRLAAGRPRPGGPGQPRPGAPARRLGGRPRPAHRRDPRRSGGRPATSSTSATASCRRPTRTTFGASSTSSTSGRRASRSRRDRRRALPGGLSPSAGRCHPGLVHAPGRRIVAEVPRPAGDAFGHRDREGSAPLRRGQRGGRDRTRNRWRRDVRRHHAARRGDGGRARADR